MKADKDGMSAGNRTRKVEMTNRILVLFFMVSFFWLGGCGTDEQLRPEIVYDYNLYPPGSWESSASAIGQQKTEDYSNIPASWIPAGYLEKKWTAIVLHHSGTKSGNVAKFDKQHKEENHWEGIGYDFVIGNGIDSGDGEVEVTFRWRRQMVGAHCHTGASNWANKEAVGICLVGNFNHTEPQPRQMQSLVKLVRFLQKRYDIPTSRIYVHKMTPGARITDCPGSKFPMALLKQMLDS